MPIAYVNGSNIKYDQYGKNKGKQILFIHGLGSSSIAWRDIPQALSTIEGENFYTIALDLIGFGGSDKLQTVNYTMKGISKFIVDFIKEVGLVTNEKKITIVGHSLGGYIATEVAIENKNIIEKLVLIDSSGMLTQPTPLLMQYLGIAMDPEPTYERVKKIFEQMYANPLMLHPLVVNAFIRTIKEPGAKHAFKTAFDDSTTRPIESERLKEVKDIPCLIIWGKYDNVIPLDHLKKFKEVFNNAAVEIIENAGHAPFVEKTALVYEKLRSFLTHT